MPGGVDTRRSCDDGSTAFPAESLLVKTTEELASDPRSVIRASLHHLGVSSDVPDVQFAVSNARSYTGLPDGLRQSLLSRFVDDIVEVEDLLGRPTGWTVGQA